MTYSQRLTKATKRAFQRCPEAGWAAARDRAKNYLNFQLGVYPSTPALIRHYEYLQRLDGQTTTAQT